MSESSDAFIGARGDRKRRLLRRTKGDLGGAEKKLKRNGCEATGPRPAALPPSRPLLRRWRFWCPSLGSRHSSAELRSLKGDLAAPVPALPHVGAAGRNSDRGTKEVGTAGAPRGGTGPGGPCGRGVGGGAAVGLSSGALCHPTALRAPRDPGQHFPFSLPPRFASPPRPLSQPCPDQRSAIPLVNDPQRSGHASRRTWGGMGTAVPPQCHRGAAPSPDAVGEHRPEEPNLHRWGTGMGPLRARSPAGPQRYRHGTPSAEPTPDAAPPRLSSTPSPSKEPPPGTRSPFLRAIRCSPQGWALPIVLMGEKGGFIVLWDGGEGGLIVLHGGEGAPIVLRGVWGRSALRAGGGRGSPCGVRYCSPDGGGGSIVRGGGAELRCRAGDGDPEGVRYGERRGHMALRGQWGGGGGEGDAAPRGGGTGGGAPIVLCGAQGGGRALSGGSRHTPSQRGSGEGGSHRPGGGERSPEGTHPGKAGGRGGAQGPE